MEEIREYERKLSDRKTPPNTAQRKLAEEMTRLMHGDDGLEIALKVTQNAAPGAEAVLDMASLEAVVADMPHASLKKEQVLGSKFTDLMVSSGFLTSKGEASRLMQNKGAYLNNVRIEDPSFAIQAEDLIGGKYLLLGSGKKKKLLLSVIDSA
jgi:tyrosyl-tRNA synthetase